MWPFSKPLQAAAFARGNGRSAQRLQEADSLPPVPQAETESIPAQEADPVEPQTESIQPAEPAETLTEAEKSLPNLGQPRKSTIMYSLTWRCGRSRWSGHWFFRQDGGARSHKSRCKSYG